MADLSIENLTKAFPSAGEGGQLVAVDDISLTVEDGEFLVMLGPSGCGKSTTLRCIAGLETPTAGQVRLGDDNISDDEPQARDMAMVFQDFALYPHMTARENMSFGLKMKTDRSSDEIGKRVQETADMMGIGDLLDKKPKQLSGGQKQRVALGRAIVRDPDLFLMDEPLSNLDAKLRAQMRTEIQQLHRKLGVTTVYVTHDQTEAMTMSDRIAILNGGVLQQVAPPDEVYHHPVNQFVAGFIGSPSMNFLSVEAAERDGAVHLVAEGDSTFDYRLDETTVERCDVSSGDQLVVGVRPEDIRVPQDEAHRREASDQPQEAILDVVEPMGSDNFLYLQVGDSPWTARVSDGVSPEVDRPIEYTFDLDTLHLFAPNGSALKTTGTDNRAYQVAEQSTVPTTASLTDRGADTLADGGENVE
ncbi:ABC transporter ATP-binding protein [Haloarcula sp. JP-L23]|uniref:ABC transporter ATP-binding protein n=1 Tax=Haloarcula sp. JP-L23 TaxID=2716717 RepID=UPI00140EE0F2|nr:ABC transporter ATP-binding protein [Haloarcula sp. JP-L23]